MKFIIDNPKDIIQGALMEGRFHEQDELELMKQYCPAKAHILDIGANVGNHSVYFSKFFDAEIIYVIEPLPRAYKMLLANLCLNYCHNVNVDYVGVGFSHDEILGYPTEIYKNNLGSTRITPVEENGLDTNNPAVSGQKFDPVPIVPGDKFFADKRIDFIKMDIEGMELVALEGLKQCIAKNRPNMFIEVSIDNIEDFHKWLEVNKYKVVWEKLEPRIFCCYMIVPEEK